VPVIVLSGSADPQAKLDGAGRGCDGRPVQAGRSRRARPAPAQPAGRQRLPGLPGPARRAHRPSEQAALSQGGGAGARGGAAPATTARCCTWASTPSAASTTPSAARLATSCSSGSPGAWRAACRPRPAASSARTGTTRRCTASTATNSR
jgi:hypothetical protein